MKKIYSILVILLATAGIAQPPQDYYLTASGTGYDLKTQLFTIIHNHNVLIYGSGLWNLYPTSDVRPDGKVWDIYANCNFTFGTVLNGGNQDNGTGGTTECELFNKEHTFPKSWFAAAPPMYSDAFHVMPADKKTNGLRGNMSYGIVSNPTYTTSNGSKIGINSYPNSPAITVFEPADEFKGDLARNYFYMATCYQDLISNWHLNNTNGAAFLDGSSDRVYEQWALNMLYSWNSNDPVSDKEIARNNAIYAAQGNRNPFIDNPQWVFEIWGAVLSKDTFDVLSGIAVYPNPTNTDKTTILSNVDLDTIQLLTINGQLLQELKKPIAENHIYTLKNIPKGCYFVKMYANNQILTKKLIVN